MTKACPCGSGQPRRELIDARGIFCTFVCDKCERAKRQNFRPDIFTDSNYWTDEPIEADEAGGQPK
jgi:hypothetical protein